MLFKGHPLIILVYHFGYLACLVGSVGLVGVVDSFRDLLKELVSVWCTLKLVLLAKCFIDGNLFVKFDFASSFLCFLSVPS